MQEQRESILIGYLKEIIQTNHHLTKEYIRHDQLVPSPVTVEDIAQAEIQLGFYLPSFIKKNLPRSGEWWFWSRVWIVPFKQS